MSDGAIGGYFELEMAEKNQLSPIPEAAVALNSARNGLEYILEAIRPTKVHLSSFTCEVVLEPFENTCTPYEFYGIDKNLEIAELPVLGEGELLLYTNYFGVKDAYVRELAASFGESLVVDASQSFYYVPAQGERVFYSPRKFFGVPDGGYAVTDKRIGRTLERDISYRRMSHLLKRLELGPEAGYADFHRNAEALDGQPILEMSALTARLLDSVAYEDIQAIRNRNFEILHESLGDSNHLRLTGEVAAPLVYPYLVDGAEKLREKLIAHRVFVATYWPNVLSWCAEGSTEAFLTRNVLALPVDQRYADADMRRILEIINGQ